MTNPIDFRSRNIQDELRPGASLAPGTPSAPQDSGQLYGHGGLSENGECLASLSGDLIVHGISGGDP